MPRVGERVVDENLKPVGMVFDVFGPVSSPYVSVKPETMESQRFVGNMLYTVPSAVRRKEKRKYGR
jgi:RNA-binding protein